MSPEDFSQYREHYIRMPSRERLQQRLGMVAMDETARAELVRLNARRSGDQFSAEIFVEEMEANIEEYIELRASQQPDTSTKDLLAQEQNVLLRKVPKILTTILSTDQDKREVLWFWFGREYERICADEPIDTLKRSRFIQKRIDEILKPDLSRKEKPRQKKPQKLQPKTRPHTSARHNGHHPRHRGF